MIAENVQRSKCKGNDITNSHHSCGVAIAPRQSHPRVTGPSVVFLSLPL